MEADNDRNGDFSSFAAFSQKLSHEKRGKNDVQFLRRVFSKTQKQLLKYYADYASFSETKTRGRYNCLTATALYALLLKDLGYGYQIIETNYHIFLLVHSTEGEVIFETTDPVNGFISDAEDVQKRLAAYRRNCVDKSFTNKPVYAFDFSLFREVTLDQVQGLLYYNEAIEAYNHQNLLSSIAFLDNASRLYDSPRIEALLRIIRYTVVQSKLEDWEKARYVNRLQEIDHRRLSSVTTSSVKEKR